MRGLRTLVGMCFFSLVLLAGLWIASWSMLAAGAFVAFAGGIGVIASAFAAKNGVDSLAVGGGTGNAWKTLTTAQKPGETPPPAPPPVDPPPPVAP